MAIGGGKPSRKREVGGGLLCCQRCGSEANQAARYCSQCGASFVSSASEFAQGSATSASPGVGAGADVERRQVTVVFCDLVGSTTLSTEVDPEDLKDIIVAFAEAVDSAMKAFGGHVARHFGDGLLIYFGYPEAHEHEAERAIQASLKALENVAALRVIGQRRLQARIGIATGLVVIGNVHGSREPGSLEATGETPNLAARLQAVAEPNTIVVSAATRRLVGDLFEWRERGMLALKGLPEPVKAWEVIGGRAVTSRYDAQRIRAPLPMLGRDADRATLLDLWKQAREGAGQVALISGEAGLGKSRMAAAILDDTDDGPRTTVRYFCSPYREDSPLHPFIQQLEHVAGFVRDDPPAAKLQKLAAVLDGTPQQDLALIAELLNVPSGSDLPVPQLGPQVKRQRTLRALLGLLERMARERSILMVFEDAQWSDETTRELLSMVVDRVVRLPVLLLVLARPEFVAEWTSRGHVTCLTLNPLTPEISAALVHFVANQRPLSARVVGDIVARTDGIPLYVEELTQAVVESGGGHAVAEPSGQLATELPLLLQASLLTRLDRLHGAREIAEIAAAIGRDFTSDLLALVVERPNELQPLLDRLVDSGLVLRRSMQQSAYTFKHALIRDAAYKLMAHARRRVLHLRIAEAIEGHFAETATNHPEVLASHYAEAHVVEKAVPFWLKAGHLALRRSAMNEALEHLHHGVDQLGRVADSPWRAQCELDFMIAIGKAQIATQGYAIDSTRATFTRAHALCKSIGDPPQLLSVLHGLWTHALLRGEFPSAQHQAEALLVRGTERNDRMWLLMGHRFSGVTHHPLGEFADATRELTLGLELYDPAKRAIYAALTVDDPRVVMLTYLSWSLMCLGRFADARRASAQAVAEATAMAHVYTQAHALNGAAFVALTIDPPQRALQRLDELVAILADSGIAYYEAVETIFRGWCHAAMGDYQRALPLLTSGMLAYRATGSLLYLSGFLRMSAEAHGWAGQHDRARELILEASAIMEATNQRWDEAEMHRIHGAVLRAHGELDAAEASYRRACVVAQQQGAKLWELRASCALADLLQARNATAAAQDVLRPVVHSFDAHLDALDLQRARAMLDGMAQGEGA